MRLLSFKNFKSKTLPKIMYHTGNDEEYDNICIGYIWGVLYIYLIYKGYRKFYDYMEEPQYGFYFYTDSKWYKDLSLWFWWGRKYYVLYMPWNYEWYRTSYLMKDGSWEHSTNKKRLEYYHKNEYKDILWKEDHKYLDKYDSKEIDTEIYVVEREWRRKWLYFTNWLSLVRKSIEVEFKEQVGSEKGSWKGGVLGCGYNMLENEAPYETLKRMEKERIF